jgi:methylated-DNA-[protein]-cysteine S-methyltransferase
MIGHEQIRRAIQDQVAPADSDRHARVLHAELARRAAAAGLLEAGYDYVDSPLGELLVAATPIGVVRVGFDSEAE